MLELRRGRKEESIAVEAQLRIREKKVVSAIEAQLQDAFERAVEVRDGELTLQSAVSLRVVSREYNPFSIPRELTLRSYGEIEHNLPFAYGTAAGPLIGTPRPRSPNAAPEQFANTTTQKSHQAARRILRRRSEPGCAERRRPDDTLVVDV